MSVWVKKKSTFLKIFLTPLASHQIAIFLQFIWGWKRISLSFTNFRALWTLLERGPTDWQNWFASLISWASELAKVLKREREIRKAEEGENHKLLLQCNDDVFISENIHKSSAFSDATGPIFTNQHNEIRQKNNIRVVYSCSKNLQNSAKKMYLSPKKFCHQVQ